MPQSASRGCIPRGEPRSIPRSSRIQNDLFDLGADLCTPGKGKGPGGARLTVTAAQVAWLESEIDRLNAELEPLRSFILPGGFAAAAYLHLARTICRRAERLIAELMDKPDESVTPEVLQYVNRLSDYLFVAARYANDKGARDVLWQPGAEPLIEKLKNESCKGRAFDGPARRQGCDRHRRGKRHRPRQRDFVRARRRAPRRRRSECRRV